MFSWFIFSQGPPGQKGDPGATEIIDYNGNLHEALQASDCPHPDTDRDTAETWSVCKYHLPPASALRGLYLSKHTFSLIS